MIKVVKKNLHWHFTSLVKIQITKYSPMLVQNKEIYQGKPSPTNAKSFLIFDDQICKIVLAERNVKFEPFSKLNCFMFASSAWKSHQIMQHIKIFNIWKRLAQLEAKKIVQTIVGRGFGKKFHFNSVGGIDY